MFPRVRAWHTAGMGLATVEMPTPMQLRGAWAAHAAVLSARDWGDGCWARGPRWHFDDSGGNWADLHHLDGGRAVLVGRDHEYSDTWWGEAAREFGEEETDLLAGAPGWWAAPLTAYASSDWIGFVYGFEDGVWQRAEYDADDGLASIGVPGLALPAPGSEDDADRLLTFAADSPHLGDRKPTKEIAEALIAADGLISADLFRLLIGDEPADSPWDVGAATLAALRFREVRW